MAPALLFAVLFSTFVLSWFLVESCDAKRSTRCLSGPQNDLLALLFNESAIVYPAYNDQVLDQLCTQLSANDCMNDVIHSCLDVRERNHFQGVFSVFNYMCTTQGRQVYEQHRHCLSQAPVTDIGVCMSSYLEQLDAKPPVHEIVTVHICRAIESFLSCLKSAVSVTCGTEAGKWIYTVNQINFTPTKQQMQCEQAAARGDVISPLIGLVALTLSISMLVTITLTVLLVTVSYRRRRLHRHRSLLAVAVALQSTTRSSPCVANGTSHVNESTVP